MLNSTNRIILLRFLLSERSYVGESKISVELLVMGMQIIVFIMTVIIMIVYNNVFL